MLFLQSVFQKKKNCTMCATASRSLQNIDSGAGVVFSLFLSRIKCCPEIRTMWKKTFSEQHSPASFIFAVRGAVFHQCELVLGKSSLSLLELCNKCGVFFMFVFRAGLASLCRWCFCLRRKNI